MTVSQIFGVQWLSYLILWALERFVFHHVTFDVDSLLFFSIASLTFLVVWTLAKWLWNLAHRGFV